MTLDLLITDATVYDGLSARPQRVSVGLVGDRIAHVGPTPVGHAAHETLQAPGLILCPGFIDSHASTGMGYLLPHAADHKLRQGVTCEVVGNCGRSEVPVGAHRAAEALEDAAAMGVDLSWRETGEWFNQLDACGLPIHAATHLGHNTLRASAGAWDATPSPAQLATMQAWLADGMRAGALGMSTGLIYAPGCFSGTDEIIALARTVAAHGGVYVSHIRDERAGLLSAIDEALAIGAAAGLPTIISHLKSAERANWGQMPAVLAKLSAAREAGQPVTAEVYPYTAVSTRLRAFLPTASMQQGAAGLAAWVSGRVDAVAAHLTARGTDLSAMTLISESLPGAQGCSITALAAARGEEPAETVCSVIAADPGAWIVYRCIDEADMDAALLWPHSMVCSDSWSYPVNAPVQVGDPHPRTFGAFTRFLQRYALTGRLPMGEAIRKMTALPADWLGLAGRGRLQEGAAADLVLLDPDRIAERATYARPRQLSDGTVQVWVSGTAMLDDDGTVRPLHPGRLLRRRIP